jgi:hypothetical protein
MKLYIGEVKVARPAIYAVEEMLISIHDDGAIVKGHQNCVGGMLG